MSGEPGPDAVDTTPSETTPSEDWRRAFAWIERELGGKVIGWEAQGRWRPAMFITLERDGQPLELYFRGDRGTSDHGIYPLEHEMRVLQLLERHDIPVPHVYGFCPEPRGIVLQRCAGRPDLGTADSEAEKLAVMDHFLELLARMHAMPVEEVEALGIQRPQTAEQLALADFDTWEKAYRGFKLRPEPLIEFGIRWVRRNVPNHRSRASFITADSGQFMFEHGRVTAVIDLELACLGDPMADLAGLRCRDPAESMGDLKRAMQRYAQVSGRAVDYECVHYHTARFALCTPMVCAHLSAAPSHGVNLPQYLTWYLAMARVSIEAISHLRGIELDPPSLPAEVETPWSRAHDWLIDELEPVAPGHYELETALRGAHYLARVDRYGRALEADDLDDVAALIGHRPARRAEADAELEQLVAAAEPARDAELVRYFQRRLLREQFVLGPAALQMADQEVQRIE